ncbi:protein TolA [Winogradskyella sp. PC-19]|uniref:cell envelope integrity protein TolA n=1 Tax=unclassified Winogradskyella TaxID=2615021 RepID=UPI000B3C8D1C|nr:MULTISPECIES: cell envelope integrity protein TolA [unclassified Winogradskyella]ARV09263.1 protein TolA [Winogradskyella sp. PC-19]
MKYLNTKHERNSAKITGLTVLIIALLMFVVGAPYKEIPEEYGVAINFGEPSVVNNKAAADSPSKAEEIVDDTQEEVVDSEELTEENPVQEEEVEEVTEEEIKQEQAEIEALEKALEEEKAEAEAKEEAAKEEAAKQEAAEKLLAQQKEEALKIKEAKEVAEKLEAEKKAKEKIEAEKFAAAKAKSEREAKARADKAEADRVAKVKAEKEAKEKAAREAKAEADRVAKAAREAKAKAEKAAAARAAQAKADADKKAAGAAAPVAKNKNGGSTTNGFKLSQEGAIYPGCEGKNNLERKKCMSNKVSQFVNDRFNKTIASDLGFTGDQKITIYFNINKNGQIIDIRARAADPKLIAEAIRVAKMLPKLEPALQQGKPVVDKFSATIRFAEQ